MKQIVEPETGGDPATGRRFVRLSLRELGRRLRLAKGTVRRLLGKAGFSLRVNVKRFTGPPHPTGTSSFVTCDVSERRSSVRGTRFSA